MTLPPFTSLTIFTVLMLLFALFGLTASGHFPAEHRAPSLRTRAGALILWASIASAAVMLGAAVLIAAERLPLYAAVLSGGGALLVAPLILQVFPDSFVDGRSGLVAFAGLGIALVVAGSFVAF